MKTAIIGTFLLISSQFLLTILIRHKFKHVCLRQLYCHLEIKILHTPSLLAFSFFLSSCTFCPISINFSNSGTLSFSSSYVPCATICYKIDKSLENSPINNDSIEKKIILFIILYVILKFNNITSNIKIIVY